MSQNAIARGLYSLTQDQAQLLPAINAMIRPPVEWDDLAAELGGTLADTIKSLEGMAERAARLARYLDQRHGNGCGDQGHESAVKAQNKAGRLVHEKVFGYNATHDIKV